MIQLRSCLTDRGPDRDILQNRKDFYFTGPLTCNCTNSDLTLMISFVNCLNFLMYFPPHFNAFMTYVFFSLTLHRSDYVQLVLAN